MRTIRFSRASRAAWRPDPSNLSVRSSVSLFLCVKIVSLQTSVTSNGSGYAEVELALGSGVVRASSQSYSLVVSLSNREQDRSSFDRLRTSGVLPSDAPMRSSDEQCRTGAW